MLYGGLCLLCVLVAVWSCEELLCLALVYACECGIYVFLKYSMIVDKDTKVVGWRRGVMVDGDTWIVVY